MRIIVTGGRSRTDFDTVWADLDARALAVPHGGTLTVIHGANPKGADCAAHEWCQQSAGHHNKHGVTVVEEPYPADWNAAGRRAGMIRNGEMVQAGADLV